MMAEQQVKVEDTKLKEELVFGGALGVKVADRGEVAVLRKADDFGEWFQGKKYVRIMLPSMDARMMGMSLINAAEESEREAALKQGVPTEPASTVEGCLAMLKELSEYAAAGYMGLERRCEDGMCCEHTVDWTEGLLEMCGKAQRMLRQLPKVPA